MFFSLITPEKGADSVIEVTKKMKNVSFHFYGHIDQAYKIDFLTALATNTIIFYHGVFQGSDDLKYKELGKYNLLLLPTRWYAEGVPGILVESKIAGVVPIVTDHNFNREIVTDDVDGIVVPVSENTVSSMVAAINDLINDNQKYIHLKQNCLISANEYYIDKYIPELLKELSESC